MGAFLTEKEGKKFDQNRDQLHPKWKGREVEGGAMRIKFVRKVKGEEMIKEFEKKYGSLKNLKRHIKENKRDYIALMNYEDWEHFIENPEIVVEEGEIIVTDATFLTVQKLELLDAIKKFEPESISELRKKLVEISKAFM